MKRLFFMALLGGLLSATSSLLAFPEMEEGSGIRVKFERVFPDSETVMLPSRVTIWNNSGRDGAWRLTRTSMNYSRGLKTSSDQVDFRVDAGETRTFDVMLQGTGQSALLFDGLGVDHSKNHPMPTGGHVQHERSELFAASNSLEIPLLAPYRDYVAKQSNSWELNRFGVFDPKQLMADWRSFLGFNRLILSMDDWTGALSSEVRDAVRQWVAKGGILCIVAKNGEIALWDGVRLNAQDPLTPTPYGSGQVISLDPEQSENNVAMLKENLSRKASLAFPVSKAHREATTFIFIFAFAFAAIIGPINLLVFAPSARRQRLFWTIPAISVGSTVILLCVILLKDGVGGEGKRYLLMQLMPGSHEALLTQTQSATTGVLMNRTFRIAEPSVFFKPGKDGAYHKAGASYSGDWFRVRSKETHELQSMRSSRMGVTFIPEAETPEIVSSIEGTLKTIVLRDEKGVYWKAANVRAGEKTRMERLSQFPREGWIDISSRVPDIGGRHALAHLLSAEKGAGEMQLERGYFIAELEDASALMINTLDSISWEDLGIVAGPLVISTSTYSAQ